MVKFGLSLLYACAPALSALLPAIFVVFVALTSESEWTKRFYDGIILGPIIASATYIITALVFCIVKEPKLILLRSSVIAFICSSLILLILFLFIFVDPPWGKWP